MSMESKSIPEELKKLANNRALILLVELMGFLHDVGKLKKLENKENPFEGHAQQFDEDINKNKVPQNLRELFEKNFVTILKHENLSENILQLFENIKIKDFQTHHSPSNWLENIISLADKKDSAEDRGKAIYKQIKFKASVFGKENILDSNLEEKRYEVYGKLEKCFMKWNFVIVNKSEFWKLLRKEIMEVLMEDFSVGLAETERAANDVTLFDHSYMTGSIAKSLLCKVISGKNSPKDFEPEKYYYFNSICDLDLLFVYFDSLSFLSQSQKLLDIRGRREVLEQIKEEVKSLIEIEYPLGNCIYEDEESLCFLITPINSDSFEFVKKKILNIFNEKTKGLLLPVMERRERCKFYGKALVELREKCKERRYEKLITNDFVSVWIKEWNSSKDKDVCILCGKMPQLSGKEKDYLCEFCWEVRYKPKEDKEGTPWIDEIADENGKIALIVGTFQPLDKWLSGEFLKYQKIRTKKDLESHSYARKYFGNISIEDYNETKEHSITKFSKLLIEIKHEKIDRKLLYEQVKNLPNEPVKNLLKNNSLTEKEATFIGGGSKVGEFYYRVGLDREEIPIEKLKDKLLEAIETKPSSPSRLFRIWRELEEFSKLEGILEGMPKGIKLSFKNEALKDRLGDKIGFYILTQSSHDEEMILGEITCYWDGAKLFTVERIDKRCPSDEVGEEKVLKAQREIGSKLDGKEIDIVLKEEESKKEVGSFKVKVANKEEYRRYRRIISSPRGFMVIVPANKAFEISKKISEDFHQCFSKSLGRLSLNIGIVFSHRKMPVFALLDAGKRFINEFFQEEPRVVTMSTKNEDGKLSFKINQNEVSWKIDTKLGDGEDDYYYPYFISSEDELLHISELTANRQIKIYPNMFDFEYFDSNIRRFGIITDESGKRHHSIVGKPGPRPYMLEDLEKFQKLLDIFKMIGSWTPIRDIESITAEKRKEWSKTYEWENIKEEYEEFVDAVLKNKISNLKDDKNFLKECVMEGSFYDAIELFESIMKMKLGEGEEYGA